MNKGFTKYVAKRQLRTRHGSVKVYLAVQRGFGREIELRIIDGGVEERSEEYLRFCREVKILAQLDHENLVKVLDFGRAGTRIWYTTEFRNAINLEALLEKVAGPLTTAEVLEVARAIGSALEHIHTKGHLHRDINATSIFYDLDNKRPYIAEFALLKDCSKYKITRQGDASALTRILTPELVMATPYSVQTDLFMLGALLYQLATNVNPLLQAADGMGSDVEELFKFDKPNQLNEDVPRYLNDVIMTLLEPLPEKRYQTAAEFLKALDTAGASEEDEASSIEVQRASVLEQFDSSVKANRPKEDEELSWDALGMTDEEETEAQPQAASEPEPEPKPEPKPDTQPIKMPAQSQADIPTRQISVAKTKEESAPAKGGQPPIPLAAIAGLAAFVVVAILFVLWPSGNTTPGPVTGGYKVTGGTAQTRPSGPFSKEEEALLAVGEKLTNSPITKNNFIRRLKVLKDYALSLADKERNEVMPYKRIMAIKVEYYRHPDRACERLTKAIDEVCQYIRSK